MFSLLLFSVHREKNMKISVNSPYKLRCTRGGRHCLNIFGLSNLIIHKPNPSLIAILNNQPIRILYQISIVVCWWTGLFILIQLWSMSIGKKVLSKIFLLALNFNKDRRCLMRDQEGRRWKKRNLVDREVLSWEHREKILSLGMLSSSESSPAPLKSRLVRPSVTLIKWKKKK